MWNSPEDNLTPMLKYCEMSLKSVLLKSLPHLLGASEFDDIEHDEISYQQKRNQNNTGL